MNHMEKMALWKKALDGEVGRSRITQIGNCRKGPFSL